MNLHPSEQIRRLSNHSNTPYDFINSNHASTNDNIYQDSKSMSIYGTNGSYTTNSVQTNKNSPNSIKTHEEIYNSIGLLENHIHTVFAGTRVPLTNEDFVYVPDNELFGALEDYCAIQTMHEPKQPLLVTGTYTDRFFYITSCCFMSVYANL